MSFFSRSGNQQPPPNPSYSRVPQGGGAGLPQGPGQRVPAPSRYEDPRAYDRRQPPPAQSQRGVYVRVSSVYERLKRVPPFKFQCRGCPKRAACLHQLLDCPPAGFHSRATRPCQATIPLDCSVSGSLCVAICVPECSIVTIPPASFHQEPSGLVVCNANGLDFRLLVIKSL